MIGNPLIADVTVRTGRPHGRTGKGYGVTNLIVLDRAGAVLQERYNEVPAPRDQSRDGLPRQQRES